MSSDKKLKVTVKISKQTKPRTSHNPISTQKASSPIASTINSPIRIVKTIKSQSNICFPIRTPKPSLDPNTPGCNFSKQKSDLSCNTKEILKIPQRLTNKIPSTPYSPDLKKSPLYVKSTLSPIPQIHVNLIKQTPYLLISEEEPSPILKPQNKSCSMTEEEIKDLRIFIHDLNK